MTTYFITGVNKGIGKSLIEILTSDKNNLVIGTVRNASTANQLLKSYQVTNLKILIIDLSDDFASFTKEFKKIDDIAPNGIDTFIHNAAIVDDDTHKPVMESDADYYTTVFHVNVSGAVKTYQAIYPYLFNNDTYQHLIPSKKIIFIGSISGITSGDNIIGGSAYGASKAALHHISKQISLDNLNATRPIINHSITLVIHPGVVDTTMHDDLSRARLGKLNLKYITTDESAAKILNITTNCQLLATGSFYDENGNILPW